jgi:hypothetical protein
MIKMTYKVYSKNKQIAEWPASYSTKYFTKAKCICINTIYATETGNTHGSFKSEHISGIGDISLFIKKQV